MLLEFTPVEGCVVVAQRFIDLLDKEHPELVASAGVACYPAHAIDASELFAASTRALEDAPGQGAAHDRRRSGRRLGPRGEAVREDRHAPRSGSLNPVDHRPILWG